MTAPSNPNPEPQVETPPNPNPQLKVETQPEPPKPNNFDPDTFFTKLDTQLKGFGEQMVSSIREAFPAPEPPRADPPKNDPPANPTTEDAPKTPEPGGGHRSGRDKFLDFWFGPGQRQ